MIAGTKSYRSKKNPGEIATASTAEHAPAHRTAAANEAVAANTTESAHKKTEEAPSQRESAHFNPSRREWFSRLIPQFGQGLVHILRESNNLKHELSEWKKPEQK